MLDEADVDQELARDSHGMRWDAASPRLMLPDEATAAGAFLCGCLVRLDSDGFLRRQQCLEHALAPTLKEQNTRLREALEDFVMAMEAGDKAWRVAEALATARAVLEEA